MSDQEQAIGMKLAEAIGKMGTDRKSYFLGFVEGVAAAAGAKDPEEPEPKTA